MIKKPRTKPPYLCQLEELDQRTPDNLPQKADIQKRLRNEKTGFKGELAVEYPLSFLPHQDFVILHGLRIKGPSNYFQIDILLLSKYLLIPLEIKNFYGLIEFEENGQFTRTGDSGKQEGYPNPLYQSMYQMEQLREFLKKNGWPAIPIYPLVVISFPSTIVRSSPANREVIERVHHSAKLPFIIPHISKQFPKPIIDDVHLLRLSNQLMSSHESYFPNIMELFGVREEEMIKGVECPKCRQIPMIRTSKTWICSRCDCNDPTAHIKTLTYDYPLLLGSKITNRQAREFLQISSPNVSKYLLMSTFPTWVGDNKKRAYTINWEEPLP
ncbi:nuclease-related domain-containing protein [Bacillus sp. FJAT-27445]|uniref:nuclease-related domain-containing protein n=1 Tax=Bacillus sp. FJAT-27445 TaxID=1679166 RepID=UPI000743CE8C|nr:nuclease-related domain-containing protein [Bacillus sp. FJAT-27445]